MEAFNTDGADEVAATIYSLLIGARLILYDLEQPKPEVNYIDALRHFDELRNAMAALVASFRSTPSLSVWYSTLPFVIVKGYIRLRRQKREGAEMVMSNPENPGFGRLGLRSSPGAITPEWTDINPNEDSDGLSHHTLQTPEDMESVDQRDPKKRRAKALRELETAIPHISIKPEKIDETLSRTPMTERDDQLLESALGVDMGQMANGGSLAAGANVGPYP